MTWHCLKSGGCSHKVGTPRCGVRTAQRMSHQEERRVAIALTGQRALPFWSGTERDAKFDASDLKGVLEEFFEQFGLR